MGFYGNKFISLNEAVKLPINCALKNDISSSVKKAKVGKFTVLFMQECDYKEETNNIKYQIEKDNWINKIDELLSNDYELSDLFKNSSDKQYYVAYYPEELSTHYLTFKSKLDGKERYFL